MSENYIHGSTDTERQRLALMNSLINERCLQTLKLSNEKLVLDVGAGTGQFTQLMATNLHSGSRIIAAEHDPQQLDAARQMAKSKQNGCDIDYRLGSAAELPLSDDEQKRIDLAHARFLLEHVPDPAAVVAGMVGALRRGGRIVLADDDHELMRLWPEPEGVLAAWRAYYLSYSHLGTDPLIGRKLVSLMHGAGARPVSNTQIFYGACAGAPLFGGIVHNIIGVLQGARATVISTKLIAPQIYDQAVTNLTEFLELPDAAVWYGINWAEGRKP